MIWGHHELGADKTQDPFPCMWQAGALIDTRKATENQSVAILTTPHVRPTLRLFLVDSKACSQIRTAHACPRHEPSPLCS